MTVWERLDKIDRKYIYTLLLLVLAWPLIRPLGLPVAVTPQVQSLYDTIEHIPKGKIAIVSIEYGVGTEGENGPQTRAIMHHLFERGVPFAVMSYGADGVKLGENCATAVAKQLGKKYGKDWCSWGLQVNPAVYLQALAKDVPGTLVKDARGTPIRKVPMMKNVRTIRDIGIITVSTGGWALGTWIQFIQGVYGTPIGYLPTAVMVPEGYDPLDAGQVCGMLPGMAGAAAYERLNSFPEKGTIGTDALSTSHILIIVLVILGNIGTSMTRRRRTGGGGAES
jgi:hypothetical protein